MDSLEEFCPNCKKSTFLATDSSQGTIVCSSCGLIIEDRMIDTTKEWREFSDGNSSGADPRRTGGIRNEYLGDGGLSLSISGNASNEGTSRLMSIATRLSNSEDRSLIKGHQLITRWGSLLNLPKKIITKAEEQFSKIESSKKSLKGRSIDSVVAAVLYIASRVCSVPLKPHDIENTTGVPIKEIKGAYKAVKSYVNYIPPLDPPRYCSNFCVKLGLQGDVASAAYKIAENIKQKRLLDGRNPRTIASAAIYIAVQLTPNCNVTLKDISTTSKIAENTIKNSYKDIYPHRFEIIPEWKNRLPLDTLHS
jgi:Transcription initiation factor TFIIIB, Brf1 subunit/Transcription initiation factor TFIIB